MNKNYIILRIIYRRVKIAKIGALSYGYLMVMLWISFGEIPKTARKRGKNAPRLA